MNIIQWLLENNHAKAQRHAENIIVLLKLNELYDLKDYEGIKARVLLYEAWKTSGLYDKKDRAECAMKAIAGELVPAPVVDMFAPELPICGVCETMHKPEEIEKLASGVEDDTTWTDYKCLITGETWTHLSHAAIAEAE